MRKRYEYVCPRCGGMGTTMNDLDWNGKCADCKGNGKLIGLREDTVKLDKHLFDTAVEVALRERGEGDVEFAMTALKNRIVRTYIAAGTATTRISPAASIGTAFHLGFETGVEYAKLLASSQSMHKSAVNDQS